MPLQEFHPAFFSTELRSDVLVATVNECTLGEEDNIELFGRELNQMIEGFRNVRLVLDLKHVSLLTSSAIGKLIGLHRNLHRRQGRLVLCGLAPIIDDVLRTAKLIDYFHVADDVTAGVELLVPFQILPVGLKPR